MPEHPRLILLNPGPVNLSDGVRQALTQPDLCHREPEFAELQATIRSRLVEVYERSPEIWAAVLLAGSGTAAVEAMLTSLVPKTGKVLVLENGVYGERMTDMCRLYGINHRRLTYSWGDSIPFDDVQRELDAHPAISHAAVVHHETTTGRLNDLTAIGELCHGRGITLLVDGVSSFAAEKIDFDYLGACAATANKCLHGAPGVSFVLVRRDLLDTPTRRGLYLDLANYCQAQDENTTPFTQPIQLYYALNQALKELQAQGGWRMRQTRYQTLARRIRKALAELGVDALLAEHESSVVLNAYRLPAGQDYETLHDHLKRRGFIVYAGQGGLQQKIFRISTMGAITDQDIGRLIFTFNSVLGP